MTKWNRSAARLLSLCVMGLLLAACSPLQPKSSTSVQAPAIPVLSPELKKEPEPTGSYFQRVTQWRKAWAETLKTLEPKSEDSKPSTGH